MVRFDFGDIRRYIEREFERTRELIIGNIESSGKSASGKTVDSIKTIVEIADDGDMSLSLIGRSNFQYLETGNPPGAKTEDFADAIMQWSKDKGIDFKSVEDRELFSFRTADKIEIFGDLQYRNGDVINIYTDEVLTAVANIDNEVNKQMIQFVEYITLD